MALQRLRALASVLGAVCRIPGQRAAGAGLRQGGEELALEDGRQRLHGEEEAFALRGLDPCGPGVRVAGIGIGIGVGIGMLAQVLRPEVPQHIGQREGHAPAQCAGIEAAAPESGDGEREREGERHPDGARAGADGAEEDAGEAADNVGSAHGSRRAPSGASGRARCR